MKISSSFSSSSFSCCKPAVLLFSLADCSSEVCYFSFSFVPPLFFVTLPSLESKQGAGVLLEPFLLIPQLVKTDLERKKN